MLAALIIVFREIIEAGLVVGIVAAVTRGVPGSGLWIAGGVLAGLAASCLTAAFTGVIAAAFSGYGQELFNASILLIAVATLAWHNIWMARHGRELSEQIRTVGRDVAAGSRGQMALALVVGIAVLREGSEVVLFLYGILVSGKDAPAMLALGGFLGLALGALLSLLTFRGLVRIPPRHIFRVTGVMITLLAAGMAAQAVGFLESAGIATMLDQLAWDSSWLLAEDSIPGRVLHTLIGYTEQPTVLQLLAYAATLVAITLASRAARAHPAPASARPGGQVPRPV